VHLTLGILRTSQAVSYALSFFQLDGFAVPAPAQVTQTVGRTLRQKVIIAMPNLTAKVNVNIIKIVDVKFLKYHFLKYFGYELPQTQINVFSNEFLDYCLYIIQEASYLPSRRPTQRPADLATTCGECGQTGIAGLVCPNCGARRASPNR